MILFRLVYVPILNKLLYYIPKTIIIVIKHIIYYACARTAEAYGQPAIWLYNYYLLSRIVEKLSPFKSRCK